MKKDQPSLSQHEKILVIIAGFCRHGMTSDKASLATLAPASSSCGIEYMECKKEILMGWQLGSWGELTITLNPINPWKKRHNFLLYSTIALNALLNQQ